LTHGRIPPGAGDLKGLEAVDAKILGCSLQDRTSILRGRCGNRECQQSKDDE
jgi:hypothetical protein